MTNFSDEQAPDAVERALAGALADRAGGTLPEATTVVPDESRLVAIEAAIDAGSWSGVGGTTGLLGRRRGALLLTAAAAVVLIVATSAVARGREDSTLVRSGDNGTTSTATAPSSPGTSTTTQATLPSTPGTAPATATTATVAAITTPGRSEAIRSVDLRNLTYPSAVCPDGVDPPEPTFTLTDGKAEQRRSAGPDGFVQVWGMELVGDTVYGDVTGDGSFEAVVMLSCYLSGTDGGKAVAVVVGLAADAPTVIGSLEVSGTAKPETTGMSEGEPRTYTPYERILEVNAVDGHLVVRWHQTEGAMGYTCLLYTSPSPRDGLLSRMPSSA